jgi:signal transduction histidine kinase/DNA-binding response OmpR family regulator/ligand-binding sensor domain-containing protein
MMRILLCLCLLWQTLTLRSEGWTFHWLGAGNGLPDENVKGVVDDGYGFVWFATSNGLVCYDGHGMRRYVLPGVHPSNNDIDFVGADGENRVWVKAFGRIYTYDPRRDVVSADGEERLAEWGVPKKAHLLWGHGDQAVWAADQDGLYRYDAAKGILTKVRNVTGTDIVALARRGKWTMALDGRGGMWRVKEGEGRLVKVTKVALSNYEHHFLYVDGDERLWIYTSHSPVDELLCYDLRENRWVDTPKVGSAYGSIVTALSDDGKGNVWIGTEDGGVCVWKADATTNGEGQTTWLKVGAHGGLNSRHIGCLYRDRQNVMWVGSSKHGVAYTDLDSAPAAERTVLKGKEDVSCLVEDASGTLWVGLDGDGIARINRQGNEPLYLNKENGALPTNLITSLLCERNGTMWAGTFGEGALRLEGGKWHRVTENKANGREAYITCMAEDDEGNVWMGTVMSGLVCQQKDGNKRRLTSENSDLATNSIVCIRGDEEGHLYVGTSTGFYLYDTRMRRFERRGQAMERLGEEFVTALYKDGRGLVWIGTRSGLKVWDERRDSLYEPTTEEVRGRGIRVKSIVEDREGNIWMGTDVGLMAVSVKTAEGEKGKRGGWQLVCSRFGEDDGLEGVVWSNGACRRRGGDCLVGCRDGFVVVETGMARTTLPKTQVLLTTLSMDGHPVEVGDSTGILEENLHLLKRLELGYSQNSFTVGVSAMLHRGMNGIRYLYRLRGEKDEWMPMVGNLVSFNALASGIYTLEVKAVDGRGWESKVGKLDVVVRPPWWRSGVAVVVYALAVMGGMLWYVKRMKRRHRRNLRRQLMEQEMSQQREMEERKMQFFTNVSHDLKTPLSLMSAPLEKVLKGKLEEGVRKELEVVWRQTRLLMEGVTQLLDFRRMDVGAERLNLKHGDMVAFVQEMVKNMQFYADNRGVKLNVRMDARSIDMNFDEGKMRRVMMNLLSNAVKYNRRGGRVDVTVGTTWREGKTWMRLTVADTGIGIKKENRERIFERFFQEGRETEYVGSGIGLYIVKEYVAMHGGEVRVEDNHPEGTIMEVMLPMDCEERKAATTVMSAEEETSTDREDATIKASAGRERKRLLVVEDNDDMREFLHRSLKDDYEVVTAENGREALERIQQEDVDMVVSDVMMPEMDGRQLCHRIKTDMRWSHIPVVMLTAKSAEQNVVEGLRDGADDYIAKPFNLEILKLRIARILEWTKKNHREFGTKMDIKPSDITVSSIDEQLIARATKEVEAHMDDGAYSVEELSRAVGMTRGHLYKKLMAITGRSPLEFIRTLRVKRGRALLEQSGASVAEVAWQVGLSPKLFAKYFKDEFGCLPSEWKKK